jgi:small-conductance mechanosensitive channel
MKRATFAARQDRQDKGQNNRMGRIRDKITGWAGSLRGRMGRIKNRIRRIGRIDKDEKIRER